jgi:uncharacterized membrane protein
MTEFLAALVVFLVAHVLPPWPPVRRRLVGGLRLRGYIAAYSVLSLVLIAWVIAAAVRAPFVLLWAAQKWQVFVPLVAMPFAAWFLIGGLAEPTPLSISLRGNEGGGLGSMAAITRHPVLWGFLLWAASHIPPNGNLVAVVMFGGVAAFAILGMARSDARARRRLGEAAWRQLAKSTSVVPFVALARGRARIVRPSPLILSAAVAVVATAWFALQGHALLIGIDPLARLGL